MNFNDQTRFYSVKTFLSSLVSENMGYSYRKKGLNVGTFILTVGINHVLAVSYIWHLY